MKRGLLGAVCLAIYCLIFLNTSSVAAQRLNAPDLEFTYACVKDNFNGFNAIISFEERIFNPNNVFIVELSDANGSFENATSLKTISDQNYSFAFETNFSLPMDISGESYKIRVRATSPAMTGPASLAFNAYYVPNTNLVLNDYTDIAICGGSKATLTLNEDVAAVYLWYKNGSLYKEGGASIEVDEAGDYYAEPYFGDCTGSIYSNIINVSFGEAFNAAIEGNQAIEACAGTTHTFKAQTYDESLQYYWYFNNTRIPNLPTYMPELPIQVAEESYGNYKLKLINEGGCESSSQIVSLQPKESSATISAASPIENLLIEGQPITLKIATSSINPRITWYKNGQLLANGGTLELNVSQPGAYFARVTAAGTCTGVLESPVFNVVKPAALSAVIRYMNDYEACLNTSTTLQLNSLMAVSENGLEVRVPENLYGSFNFTWKKDGTPLNNSQAVLPITSFNDNGSYRLEVGYNNLKFATNALSVQLGIPDNDILADTDFICSNNGQATLSVTSYEGAVYNWYFNDKLLESSNNAVLNVTNAGTYSVETILKGCAVFSEDFKLNSFGENVVQIFPSQQVYIQTGGSENVYATGADSYQWVNAKGMVISSSDSFIATQEGEFFLVAQKDGCEIRKKIVVGISDVTEVPNIITPNQDNINDKWVLPAQFVNDPDVEVMICDTYGKPVLKTKSYQNNWPMNTEASNYEASIYYYSIQKNGESLRKGSITVVNR
jgi:gliding motility-associated-like protein